MRHILLYLMLGVGPTASAEEFRRWSDSTGQFSLEASFIAQDSSAIKLRRRDGSVSTISRSRLSKVDLDLLGDKVRDQLATRIREVKQGQKAVNESANTSADEQLRTENAQLRRTIRSLNDRIATLEANAALRPIHAPPRQADGRMHLPNGPAIETSGEQLYAAVGGGHWISDVSSDGGIVTLEDGSVWSITNIDRLDSTLWLTTEDIVVIESSSGLTPFKLINTDSGDTVEASLLSH